MKIAVFTGAGISAESGLQTFRASDGLWEEHKIEDVATPEGYHKNPQMVWDFYRKRYYGGIAAWPNPAHKALTQLQHFLGNKAAEFKIITQNVDGLHERASGDKNVIRLHGSIHRFKCGGRLGMCNWKSAMDPEVVKSFWEQEKIPTCPGCLSESIRPDIVWFNEPLPADEINAAYDFAKDCTHMLVIGTSAQIFPAADLIYVAAKNEHDAIVYEFNLERCIKKLERNYRFFKGEAGQTVPAFVQAFIDGANA